MHKEEMEGDEEVDCNTADFVDVEGGTRDKRWRRIRRGIGGFCPYTSAGMTRSSMEIRGQFWQEKMFLRTNNAVVKFRGKGIRLVG